MLEYFYLDTAGISERNYEISLTVSGNKLYYRFTYEGRGNYVYEGERYYGDDWSRRFEDLHFSFWQPEYDAGILTVGGGFAWEIFYKEAGSPARYIKGNNTVCPKWHTMIGLLEELDPQSLVQELTNVPDCSDIF